MKGLNGRQETHGVVTVCITGFQVPFLDALIIGFGGVVLSLSHDPNT